MPDYPSALKHGCIITGVDTDAGKTIVAAVITKALNASYWKPLQTGLNLGHEANDSATVTSLTGCKTFPNAYRLQQPLSPAAAAKHEDVIIYAEQCNKPETSGALVIEGAGGVLVPINDKHVLIDLFGPWRLPIVVVITGKLGGVNHALLTLEALYKRCLPVAGLVLNGDDPRGNLASIIQHAPQQDLPAWHLPTLTNINETTIANAASRIFADG